MYEKVIAPHPGILLRDNVIKELNLTVTEAARLLKVAHSTLSYVLAGHSEISIEMSIRISMVFGGSPEIWTRLQTAYNLQKIRPKLEALGLQLYKGQEHKFGTLLNIIGNSKRLSITKSLLLTFQNALQEIRKDDSIDPVLAEIQISAIQGKIADFIEEIKYFESYGIDKESIEKIKYFENYGMEKQSSATE